MIWITIGKDKSDPCELDEQMNESAILAFFLKWFLLKLFPW